MTESELKFSKVFQISEFRSKQINQSDENLSLPVSF